MNNWYRTLRLKAVSMLVVCMMVLSTSLGMVGVAQAAAPIPADSTLPAVLNSVEQILASMDDEEWAQFLTIRDQFYDNEGNLKDSTVDEIVARLQEMGLADEFEDVINANVTVDDAKFIICLLCDLAFIGRDNVAGSIPQVTEVINQLKEDYNAQIQKLLNRGINQEKAYQFIVGVNARLEQNTILVTDDFEAIVIQAALNELKADSGQKHPELYTLAQDALTRLKASVADSPVLGAIIPSTVEGITPAMVQAIIDNGLEGVDGAEGLVDLLEAYNSFVGVLARFYVDEQVATPAMTPAPGTYTAAQSVTITCATAGAAIRYTTNGSEPTEASTLYTATIPVSSTTTIKAKAYKSGMAASATAVGVYTIQAGGSSGSGGGPTTSSPSLSNNAINNAIALAAQSGKVALQAPAGAKVLSLNPEQLKMIVASGKPLEVKIGNVTFNVPSAVLKQSEFNLDDIDLIQFNASSVTTSQVQASNAGLFNVAGEIYELSIGVEPKKGTKRYISKFTEGIGIGLAVSANAKDKAAQGKITVGYFNEETKAWEDMNGKYDAATDSMSFVSEHFSKFAVLEKRTAFTDIAGHWAKGDIEFMASNGFVGGVGNGLFAPDASITRAQFAAFLVRVLGVTETAGNLNFTDAKAGDWYYNTLATAYSAGLIKGVSDDKIAPNDNITREQMAVMIVRAMEYKNKTIPAAKDLTFTDKGTVAGWAATSVSQASQLTLVGGFPDGSFGPQANATRAQAIVMLHRVYNQIQ